MKFDLSLCGKTYKYETPAELIELIRPDMEKAETDFKTAKAKAEEAYKKIMDDAEKKRKVFFVLRKAIEQLSGKQVSTPPAKTAPAAEPKKNAGQ